jgi:hypothetical protein
MVAMKLCTELEYWILSPFLLQLKRPVVFPDADMNALRSLDRTLLDLKFVKPNAD